MYTYDDATLIGCTFRENSATAEGGGIFNTESDLTLTNSTFVGNVATGQGIRIADPSGVWSAGNQRAVPQQIVRHPHYGTLHEIVLWPTHTKPCAKGRREGY